jgi:hypothetical protein
VRRPRWYDRLGSIATEAGLFAHVRFTLGSGRTADIPNREFRANSRHGVVPLNERGRPLTQPLRCSRLSVHAADRLTEVTGP